MLNAETSDFCLLSSIEVAFASTVTSDVFAKTVFVPAAMLPSALLLYETEAVTGSTTGSTTGSGSVTTCFTGSGFGAGDGVGVVGCCETLYGIHAPTCQTRNSPELPVASVASTGVWSTELLSGVYSLFDVSYSSEPSVFFFEKLTVSLRPLYSKPLRALITVSQSSV